MKILILLFLYVTVTCQAQQWPNNGRQMARKGDEEFELSMSDPLYERLNQRPPRPSINSRVTYPTIHHQYPRPFTSHVNNIQNRYSHHAPDRFASPAIHNRFQVNEADQIRPTAQTEKKTQHLQQSKDERETRLAQVDKEALSKLSEEHRQILESQLSATEREALLTKLEDGQLDDILPREENRFGGMGASGGGFSSAAAQIGASAGRYIGGKLAGSLGARLGAAAGAYLGAAAASRFVKKTPASSEDVSDNSFPEPSPYPNNYGNTFGAVMVNNK